MKKIRLIKRLNTLIHSLSCSHNENLRLMSFWTLYVTAIANQSLIIPSADCLLVHYLKTRRLAASYSFLSGASRIENFSASCFYGQCKNKIGRNATADLSVSPFH